MYDIIIYTSIFTLGIYYIYSYFHKQIYVFALKNFITPKSAKENKYFIDNFEKIIRPFYNGEINVNNEKININRNIKNQCSLINKNITKDIVDDLINPSNETLDILLKRLIPFIHVDNKPVRFEDLIVVDVLTATGSYFPSFHTDVEWRTFYNNNGFQIWILLDEDPLIKPRGNMFIMESDIVEPGLSLHIDDDHVNVLKNNSADTKLLKSYNSLSNINPCIKYLNSNVGDVFIMNPSLFHCSDPKNIYSNRRAINMRVVHKVGDNLKLGDLSNPYTMLIRSKHLCSVYDNHCELNFNNKNNRYKFK